MDGWMDAAAAYDDEVLTVILNQIYTSYYSFLYTVEQNISSTHMTSTTGKHGAIEPPKPTQVTHSAKPKITIIG